MPRLGRALRSTLLVIAIAYLAAFVFVAFKRALHPFELEWMEGAMVDHVERVLRGQPLYVEPTIDFVPFIYGPLYYWASAVVAKVVGLSFLPLRIVSILSALGAFAFIHAIVARETEDRTIGVVAAGAFAASYAKSAQFLDICRVDSLSLVTSLAAVHVMRNLRARRGYWLLGAAMLGLSFLAKQSSFLLALALIAHEAWVERRRAIPFVVATLASTLGVAAILDWSSQGWFRYYTWELPRAHAIVKQSYVGFWTDDLFPAYAIAGVFAVYFLVAARPRRDGARLFHLMAAGGLVACAWTGRLHDGGWPNVLIPAFAALSVLLGIGLGEALRAIDDRDPRLSAFVSVAALLQLLVLAWDPKRMLPTKSDARLGWALIEKLKAAPGDVFVPNHSWYARMAGKPAHAHRMAIDDVFRGDPYEEGAKLSVALRSALARKKWAMVMLDDDFYEREARGTYDLVAPPFPTQDGFFPVTGIHVRPQKTLIARP
ncbi:MAG: glycosyltransferase family 39 protein [Deltaproteobacteria bacterium]|nr:glycosyltransferase family 39 protein [Deltaproteobacteria bacterium]